MQTLIVKIDTNTNAVALLNFLKTLPYIKSITAKNTTQTVEPLTAADWVRPGRPATDEEIELMLDECEQEKGGYTTTELKKRVKQWKAK